MKKIYRTYADTEVVMLATNIKCPYCGKEWQETDMNDCGETYQLICDNCKKEFEMYFDADQKIINFKEDIMIFKKCTSKVKGYYYYCIICNKQIDYYEHLKYDGKCELCYYC